MVAEEMPVRDRDEVCNARHLTHGDLPPTVERRRGEEEIGPDLRANRVVVPYDAAGSVVLTLQGGARRTCPTVEHRDDHAHDEKERREPGREEPSSHEESRIMV